MSFDVLAYQAPFLIEKLLKDRIVETPEEGEVLFAEVKKYLLLTQMDADTNWHMYSLRVDEVWHQFVLFTWEYVKFCTQFFGKYRHHAPSNAPKPEWEERPGISTFAAFQRRYEEVFGAPLPDVWYDENSVTVNRRLLNDRACRLTLRDDDGMVEFLDDDGRILLSVNELAREALAFIARMGAFIVRELPGDLTDEEKIGLVATLVKCKVLRVGS